MILDTGKRAGELTVIKRSAFELTYHGLHRRYMLCIVESVGLHIVFQLVGHGIYSLRIIA